MSLKQFTQVLKIKKFKETILLIIKNLRNENYFDAMNLANKVVFNKNLEFDYIFNINIVIKEVLVVINLNSQVVKYKKLNKLNLI